MGGETNDKRIRKILRMNVHGRDGLYLITLIEHVREGVTKGRKKSTSYEQAAAILEAASNLAKELEECPQSK